MAQTLTGCPKMQNCKNSDFGRTERGRKTLAEILKTRQLHLP